MLHGCACYTPSSCLEEKHPQHRMRMCIACFVDLGKCREAAADHEEEEWHDEVGQVDHVPGRVVNPLLEATAADVVNKHHKHHIQPPDSVQALQPSLRAGSRGPSFYAPNIPNTHTKPPTADRVMRNPSEQSGAQQNDFGCTPAPVPRGAGRS